MPEKYILTSHEAKLLGHTYNNVKGEKLDRNREKQNPGVLIPSNQESLAQETSFTSIFSCQPKFRREKSILTTFTSIESY